MHINRYTKKERNLMQHLRRVKNAYFTNAHASLSPSRLQHSVPYHLYFQDWEERMSSLPQIDNSAYHVMEADKIVRKIHRRFGTITTMSPSCESSNSKRYKRLTLKDCREGFLIVIYGFLNIETIRQCLPKLRELWSTCF